MASKADDILITQFGRIEELEDALREILEECQNNVSNPIVAERMIDRIHDTALRALGVSDGE